MSFVTVLILFLILASLLVAWQRSEESGKHRKEDVPAPAAAPAPESLEGVLVAQVVTGMITCRQYRREMARLAARDEKRHPLGVPPPKAGAAGDA